MAAMPKAAEVDEAQGEIQEAPETAPVVRLR